MTVESGAVLVPLVKLGKKPGDCWAWLGDTDPRGYPRKMFNGTYWQARRWIWFQLFGPIPDGLVVMSSCDNRGCVNPHHLRCCFHADAIRAGMKAVLTADDVAEIRRWSGRPLPTAEAARMADTFGVTPTAIYDVLSHKGWGRKKRSPRCKLGTARATA